MKSYISLLILVVVIGCNSSRKSKEDIHAINIDEINTRMSLLLQDDNKEKRLVYKLNDNGEIIEANIFNLDGTPNIKYSFRYYEDGNISDQIKYRYSKFIFKYDDKGRLIKNNHFNSDGVLTGGNISEYNDVTNSAIHTNLRSGINVNTVIHTKHSENGDTEVRVFYNSDGNLTGIYTIKYDSKGREIEAINDEIYQVERLTSLYDDYGNILEECEYYDGKQLSDKYSFENIYDTSGFLVKRYQYDKIGKLFFITKYINDSVGNVLESTSNEPFNEDVFFRVINRYDENGMKIEKRKYEYGQLLSITTYKYDSFGNIIEECVFDEDDVIWYKEVCLFDDNGKIIESLSYHFVERVKYTYDSRGRRKEELIKTW